MVLNHHPSRRLIGRSRVFFLRGRTAPRGWPSTGNSWRRLRSAPPTRNIKHAHTHTHTHKHTQAHKHIRTPAPVFRPLTSERVPAPWPNAAHQAGAPGGRFEREVREPAQHGLPSNKMARITSGCDAMRSPSASNGPNHPGVCAPLQHRLVEVGGADRPRARDALHGAAGGEGRAAGAVRCAWSKPPIRDTGCCCRPLTGVCGVDRAGTEFLPEYAPFLRDFLHR